MKRKNKQEQKVWLAASSTGRLPPAIETGGKRPLDEVVWIAQQTRRRLKRITISLCSTCPSKNRPVLAILTDITNNLNSRRTVPLTVVNTRKTKQPQNMD